MFYSQMGYEEVRRWTRGRDIFAHDIILVPVHIHNHWTIAIIDLRVKHIKYMDSLGGENNECLDTLLDYLAQELKDKKNRQLDVYERRRYNDQNLPKQENGSDCGVFTLKFADFVARDAEINFTQGDMPFFRERIMLEILQSTILPSGCDGSSR